MLSLNNSAVRFIVVHCSATKPNADIGVAEIRQWHLERGWDDIGYHVVIRRDGTVEHGRDMDLQGAHVAGHNHESIGICMVGGVDATGLKPDSNFTAAQWASLESLVAALLPKFPGAVPRGHRDFPGVNKACPCFDVKSWWVARSEAA